MRITFVAISYENLGISQISAIAKEAGHDVNLAFTPCLFNDRLHISMPAAARLFDDTNSVLKKIEKQNPDVIAFSPTSGMYQWALNVAGRAKDLCPHAKTVFGGIHTSAVPDRVISRPEVDYACVGEGDAAFLKILEHIQYGGEDPIINTRYKTNDGRIIKGRQCGFIQDLDALPILDKTLWENDLPHNDFFITSAMRGCPNRCTYCFNSFYPDIVEERTGPYLRRRSPEHILHELRVFQKRYRYRIVEFFDDIFTLDLKWLKEFAHKYRRDIGVPYQIFTHVKYVDEDRAKLLADSGCVAAQMGVQTLDHEYKYRTLNRRESSDDIGRAIDLLKHYGVKPKMDHMLGLPNEPIDAQEKAVQFYAEHTPYRIQTYWTNYFPGTRLLEEAVADGRLSLEESEKLKDGYDMDTFTRSNKMIDPQKTKMYQAYEWFYELLPNLPYALRKKLSYKAVAWMPRQLLSFLAFFSDMLIGLAKLDRDHISYAQAYVYWIAKNICNRLGFSFFPAARLYSEEHIEFYPPQRKKSEEDIFQQPIMAEI